MTFAEKALKRLEKTTERELAELGGNEWDILADEGKDTAATDLADPIYMSETICYTDGSWLEYIEQEHRWGTHQGGTVIDGNGATLVVWSAEGHRWVTCPAD